MDPNVLTPVFLGQGVDGSQEISGQRRMIEDAAVLISPFQTVLVQNFGEAIKNYRVVGADGIVRDRELQGQRDERERENADRAQIAFGFHP